MKVSEAQDSFLAAKQVLYSVISIRISGSPGQSFCSQLNVEDYRILDHIGPCGIIGGSCRIRKDQVISCSIRQDLDVLHRFMKIYV
jgi:hypothetical protein